MRTEPSRSTRGIQGFSSRGSARHALSIPFAYHATFGQSAFFRAKESSGFGSGATTTTTAFSRATEDLPNALPFSGGRPSAADRRVQRLVRRCRGHAADLRFSRMIRG
jgi:hypothetical protein